MRTQLAIDGTPASSTRNIMYQPGGAWVLELGASTERVLVCAENASETER